MKLNMMNNMFGIKMFVAFSDGLFDLIVPSDSRWAIMLVAVGDINKKRGVRHLHHPRTEPTKPMIEFAKQQGQFKPEHFSAFDKLQIVTVQEILDGARMNLPLIEEVTKRAQKVKADNQAGLFED
ncbi:hypothetical protein BH10ACI1_BH10ACI1_32640 [soil metagenome]